MKKIVNMVTTCKSLSLDTLESFQGNLKKTKSDVLVKLKQSLSRKGIIFPLFVWYEESAGTNWILDGVHRVVCLKELRNEGYEIDTIPVVYVQARTMREAKKFVLLANSQYAAITKKGFNTFIDNMAMENLIHDVNFIEFSFDDQEKVKAPEKEKLIDETVEFIYKQSDLAELQSALDRGRILTGLTKDTDIILSILRDKKERERVA